MADSRLFSDACVWALLRRSHQAGIKTFVRMFMERATDKQEKWAEIEFDYRKEIQSLQEHIGMYTGARVANPGNEVRFARNSAHC